MQKVGSCRPTRRAPRVRPKALAASVLAGGAFLAMAAPPAGTRAATEPPTAIGVNMAGAPGKIAPLRRYAHLAGRKPAVVMWYQQWSDALFYPVQLRHVAAVGALPIITWDPMSNGKGIPLALIAAGSYDSYIKASARAAVRWGRSMYIRFANEMNAKSSAYGPGHDGDTPGLFVAAWRHVVRIFRNEGARNVEWIWSPNVYCDDKCPFDAYYPGDAWVDWVALDGYNYSSVDHVPWMSFNQIFHPSYKLLTALTSKPVMIGETASTEQGGDKAKWILNALHALRRQYPRVHALVWFDRIKETDWRVNSSPASLAAWRKMVRTKAYSGTASTLKAVEPFSQ
jgi:hypothetical protein